MAQNGDVLLNYILQLDVRTPTPDANTDYLRAVVAVVKPKEETPTGKITKVISAEAASALTDNADVAELFKGGLNSALILPVDDLSAVGTALASATEQFYTVLISSDFNKTEIDSLDVGTFDGVVGAAFEQQADAKAFAAQSKRCGAKSAKNLFYAFGQLLSASSWSNLQYIDMPYSDGVTTVDEADSLFEDKVTFVLDSPQYGRHLGLFAAGGQAIIAPYITQELIANLQGAALQYLNLNRPQYTLTQAKLLEDYLTSDADARYVQTKLLDYARVNVSLAGKNYEGTVSVSIPEPTALWRLKGILTQEAL